MNRAQLALALSVCCLLAVPALSSAARERPAPPTVRVTAEVDSFSQVDAAPEGDSAGDMLVFTQKLTDAAGRQVGTASAFCIRTVPGKSRECQGTFVLPRGQVFVSGPDPDGVTRHDLAIVGGTGAYRDIRGRVTLLHESAVKDRDTFRFKR